MIKAIDAAQGGPIDGFAGPIDGPEPIEERANPKSEILHPKSEVPLLTPEEKRRILARIARVNPLDCFDESGAFDIVKAKRILPPGMVRHIAVHETTRLNAEGQPVTQRRIHVRLVDPVSALRLDDQLERRRERSTSSSTSPSEPDPNSPPPHPASPEYAHNLLRKNTLALDEANHTLAQLRKALAEKEERKRQLSKQLDEKDQQLSKTLSLSNESKTLSPSNGSETLSKVEGQRSLALQSRDQSQEAGFSTPLSGKSETQNSSNPTLPNRAASTQRDTGCQPVEVCSLLERETGCQPVNPKNQHAPQALSEVEQKPLSSVKDPHSATKPSSSQPPRKSLDELPYHELPRRKQEIEDRRTTSSPTAFAAWLKATSTEPPGYRSGAPRPPPQYHPMSLHAQGMPKEVR